MDMLLRKLTNRRHNRSYHRAAPYYRSSVAQKQPLTRSIHINKKREQVILFLNEEQKTKEK